MKITILLS